MNILFKILKLASWVWVLLNSFIILLFLVIGSSSGAEAVHYILFTGIASPAIIFLLWRYKEEK